jgi:hypothetical protein
MNTDHNDQPDQTSDFGNDPTGDGSVNAEQLADALSDGGETTFVMEKPRALNRSTAIMFAVLVLGAGSIYFMWRKTGPKAAVAAVSKETADAKKTISSFLSGGDSNIKLMETMLRNTQKVVQQFLTYPSMTQVPLSDLRTNPFRHKNPTPQAAPADNSGASDMADKRRREEERLTIRKAADGLQVQSIMYSDSRKACMINNTLFREGQGVEGFILEKINPNSVIVKNGPYRFELSLKR